MDDEPAIDWSDFEKASDQSRDLVRRLAADRHTLGKLVRHVGEDDKLMEMCERHRLLDKVVFYDDLPRGMRLRLHFSTDYHLDRPHDHRFSFTTLIIRGEYTHVWHEPDESVDPNELTVEDLLAKFATVEREGACYTLHHSLLHTTITTDDTVSLFLRGPAEKERSIVTDRETGRVWWRYGAMMEDAQRRSDVCMSHTAYVEMVEKAERLGVIA